MNDRERAIVMAYTGVCMLTGDRLNEFYKYLSELYCRPVYTHEIAELDIRDRAYKDFLALCKETEKTGKWLDMGKFTDIDGNHHEVWKCDYCGYISLDDSNYCPHCGARMEG